MIDNISNGRVAIAAANGWHVNDFVLAPANFISRRDIMLEALDSVRRLWRGETLGFLNGENRSVEVRIFPAPIQPELPIWLTTSSESGSRVAATRGFNLLTSNFTHNYSEQDLGKCIYIYRTEMQATHGRRGHVTLMLHTYVAESEKAVNEIAVPAMTRYLEANIELQEQQDRGRTLDRGYGGMQGRRREILTNMAARQNVSSRLNLIADVETCAKRASELERLGVDEIACLIDFGIPLDQTMASLERLSQII